MTISSRTPEGTPSRCSLCGYETNVEFSPLGEDATCPNCGHLLWLAAQVLDELQRFLNSNLGTAHGRITPSTRLDEIGVDSLGAVELVMLLEEEFDIDIPEQEAANINTIEDVIRYIEQHKRRKKDT